MSDRTVAIKTYPEAMHAEFDRGILAQRGIPAFVEGANVALIGPALGGVARLMVREEDFEAASAALAEDADAVDAEEPEVDEAAFDEPDEPDEPDASARLASEGFVVTESWARWTRFAAFALVPVSCLAGWFGRVTAFSVWGKALLLVGLWVAYGHRKETPAAGRALTQSWIALVVAIAGQLGAHLLRQAMR